MSKATSIVAMMGVGFTAPQANLFINGSPEPLTLAVDIADLDVEAVTFTLTPGLITGLAGAQGGSVTMAGGTSSTSANAGGAVTVKGGLGGATGAGGAVTIGGAAGGATSGSGGATTITTGAGTAGNAVGGTLTIIPGASQGTGTGAAGTLDGGSSGTGATGNGGTARLRGGAALSEGGTGGTATVVGGAGGTVTGSGGAIVVTGGTGAPTGRGGHITITGGSAGATSGNGGDIITVGGTGTGSGVEGGLFNRLPVFFRQRAPYALTGAATMTAATLVAADMLLTGNPGGGAGVSYQLPTATALDSALPSSMGADDAIMFRVINLSTVAAEDITLTTNTGWTLVGSMVIESRDNDRANASATFIVRFTAANNATLYRVA